MQPGVRDLASSIAALAVTLHVPPSARKDARRPGLFTEPLHVLNSYVTPDSGLDPNFELDL